ncbi:hypothetical protein ACFX12_033684 [Malus domestica]
MFCRLETLRLIICQPQSTNWALFLQSEAAAAGETMVARSWTEMQCPGTGQIKHGKVAEVGG